MKLKYDDKHHAYWLDGKRCKGVTTVAKIPDDMYSINQWRLRMCAIGMALSPKLVETVAHHKDVRDKVEDAAEQALEVAKANDASARGTNAHRITELIDSGIELVETPLAKQVRALWAKTLKDAALEIVPQFVERIVVYPELYIAGRFDRIVRRADGTLAIVDFKTGESTMRYPHSIAVQLALYANAPLLAGPIPAGGGQTETFEPLPPELDKDVGYVIHMPDETTCQVYEIDIAAGWNITHRAIFPILAWRKTSGLAQQQISAAAWNPTPRLVAEDGAVETQDPPPVSPVPSTIGEAWANFTPPSTARLHWIEARCRKIVDAGLGRALMADWPADIPTFRNGGPRDDRDITRLSVTCDRVEAKHGLPFPPADPNQPTTTKATIKQQKEQTHEPV